MTGVIHRAYARHARQGLQFWATRQTVDDTARRFDKGQGFVAELDGALIGTITMMGPRPDSPVAWYREAASRSFGQFAVDPGHGGCGVGRALHEHVLACAREEGAQRMVIDTAAPADELIAMYRAWGYEICGDCDWRPKTNYPSIVMTRALA